MMFKLLAAIRHFSCIVGRAKDLESRRHFGDLALPVIMTTAGPGASVSSLRVAKILPLLVRKKQQCQERALLYSPAMQANTLTAETRCRIYFKIFQGNKRGTDKRKASQSLKMSKHLYVSVPTLLYV